MEIKIKITEENEGFIVIAYFVFTLLFIGSLSSTGIIHGWVFWAWTSAYFPIFGISKIRIKWSTS